MIRTKSDLKFYLQEDRNIGDISKFEYILISLYRTDGYKVYQLLKALRKYEYFLNQPKNIITQFSLIYRKIRWHRLGEKYNIVLPPNVIGYGFRIAHVVGGGCIINCKSIGNYCSANAGVIVGNNGSQDKIAIIGNNVSLLIGSKIIGKVKIGDNASVAPNAVVIHDVPANAIVGGVPAKILKMKA